MGGGAFNLTASPAGELPFLDMVLINMYCVLLLPAFSHSVPVFCCGQVVRICIGAGGLVAVQHQLEIVCLLVQGTACTRPQSQRLL